MIHIVCPSRYKIDNKLVRRSAEEILAANTVPSSAVLNIVFVGTRKMKEIANTYKHEDVALPVLAFAYKESETELPDPETAVEEGAPMDTEQLYGEIFLCYPQVVLLAAERGKKVDEMIDRLVEHGLNNIIQDKSTPVRP
jgi:ssRNA-specific RNase YbeY (16S rRNA maturation enzyme)